MPDTNSPSLAGQEPSAQAGIASGTGPSSPGGGTARCGGAADGANASTAAVANSARPSLDDYKTRMLGVFQPAMVLTHGQGAWVWDQSGRKYLDLLAGIAVNALGHAHPAWVEAVSVQASNLAHISNLFASEPQINLASKILQIANAPAEARVFFTNSGTEAAEAALKAALKSRAATPSGAPAKHRVLALEGSFHGRSLGALAMTAKPAYREPYAPFTGPVEFLPAGDIPALEQAFAAGDVLMMALEVIQGEAGVRPLGADYVAAARRLTSQHGAWLWIDEVQTGCGRCGTWMAHQNEALAGAGGVQPDLLTLAKGLGGGFPIGAMVAMNAQTAALLAPGDHGTTFGGGPLACAAALATLETIEQDGLIEHAAQVGDNWRAELAAVPGVKATRGAGQLTGVVLDQPVAPQVVKAALAAGFIINAPAPDVLRLAPPLILTEAQARTFTAALPGLITQAKEMT